MHPTQSQNSAFACLELSPEINRQLDKLGFITPTPIQAEAIPHALAGRDVVGIAQTGTGKTFAFGLPMIQKLLKNQGMALILAPTRELALQIEEELKKIGATLGLKTAVLIGGAPMNKQVGELRRRPHVIVATPGRLKDHLYQKTCTLRFVSIVVLDEADRMFDMGFAPVVKEILNQVPAERQTMLFSATMGREVSELTARYLNNPVRIEIAPEGTPSELVEQEVHIVPKEGKPDLLGSVLYDNHGTVLVFSRTRHGAKRIARNVREMGHTAAELHSDRTLAQRKAALAGFKSGMYRVLVATDIAARGIDVKEIELVVNYDLPDCLEDYVHRIGRTGRAGSSGRAVSFAQPDQHKDVRQIERLIGKSLAVVSGSLPASSIRASRPRTESRPSRSADTRPFNRDRSRPSDRPVNLPERTDRTETADRTDKPSTTPADIKPRRQIIFTPRVSNSVEPTPAAEQKHHRPKPTGTPKKYQAAEKKPRWVQRTPASDTASKPRTDGQSSPQAHRPGIGGNNGNRTDRPAYGGGRSGPKRFGKPRR